MMPRILLAIHGGESARGAARVAMLLATRLHAEVDAITVAEPAPILEYGYGPVIIPDADADRAAQEAIRKRVREQLDQCGLEACDPRMFAGAPASCIAAEAEARGDTLIVVGIGPHHLVDRALGGETALRLVQVAAAPVLAVPGAATALPRRAVAAIDFSPTSLRAARTAATLLVPGDTLHLVHVGAGRAEALPASDGKDDHARRRLSALRDEIASGTGIEVTALIEHGSPARALLDVVQRTGSDLIALGSHGYGPWERLVVGSVASKVLRLATCAVLVVPATAVARTEASAARGSASATGG
ncbi:MAG TPA: universal stress protein [Gemmatimonadaceae bacterium]|nr:universal stress protein [Gemmatimonadaceae bacterium]